MLAPLPSNHHVGIDHSRAPLPSKPRIGRWLSCRVHSGQNHSTAESTAPRPSSMSQAPGSGQTDCPRPGHRQDHLLVYPAPGHCSEHPDPLLGGISSVHPTPTYINICYHLPVDKIKGQADEDQGHRQRGYSVRRARAQNRLDPSSLFVYSAA